MDVLLLKYSYSYKWDHIRTLHPPPKKCMELEHAVFSPTFFWISWVAGFFGRPSWIPKSWGFEHPDDVTSTLILRWQVVSRWFQVFPGIFTLLGGWCSCSILRRLFCFQVAQPPTRISSNLIQWDVPNSRSEKTFFLPWMGYLNVVPRYQGVQHSECFILMA